MSDSNSSSAVLLARWRDTGDQAAIERYLDRHARQLVGIIRHRLYGRLGRRLDAEDIAQSAWRSFCIRVRDGRIELNGDSAASPWQRLARLAILKLLREVEFHKAAKRSINAEESVTAKNGDAPDIMSPDPTPDQIVALESERELLLQGFSAEHQRIIDLHFAEQSSAQIAEQVGLSERMVREVVSRFWKRVDRRSEQLSRM